MPEHSFEGAFDLRQICSIQDDLSGIQPDPFTYRNVGKYDGMMDWRDVGHGPGVAKILQERVLGIRNLAKRIFDPVPYAVAVRRKPLAIRDLDSTSLDLKNKKSFSRIQQDEVRLTRGACQATEWNTCH